MLYGKYPSGSKLKDLEDKKHNKDLSNISRMILERTLDPNK
jgi:hypothetical protein